MEQVTLKISDIDKDVIYVFVGKTGYPLSKAELKQMIISGKMDFDIQHLKRNIATYIYKLSLTDLSDAKIKAAIEQGVFWI